MSEIGYALPESSPSGFLRAVLKADSVAASSTGTVVLLSVLLALVLTETVAGFVAAIALFGAWVAVGWTGRRHQRIG
ncbi:hypothetical protein [Streptomyces sp. NPDC039028]|uniref:hypothetical protein n=1 Tax=unclassified Streptomyces TaxID=2593676 RepID=UPI0033E35674